MSTTALKAHFDGERIVLDEPFHLPLNASLLVTVLPDQAGLDSDEREWLRAGASSDAFKFLADPAEDVYTITDGKPFRDDI
jgi:hypothetical protein